MMSIDVERATVSCQVCGAQVSELRRGRCWNCYMRWTEARPVGRGAACACCAERRQDNLRLVEVHTRSVPLCHNCATRIFKMADVPSSLEAIRARLVRERREEERRQGGHDHRIFPRERRVGDRRRPAQEVRARDPGVQDFVFDELVIELDEDDIEIIETTNVRERPTARNPTGAARP
jgi:hypothetical protein